MRPFHSTGPRMLTILAALVTLAVTSLSASTVSQFNLAEMSRRAQKIYVGTVRSATEGTLAVGGGQLAVVTYRAHRRRRPARRNRDGQGRARRGDSDARQAEGRPGGEPPIRVARCRTCQC